mmetsp:Transcript_129736/g.250216  ORF Transcript_129736/g.250216 Transcript_129736/m.250216 type:complete len:291 (+) Transcript_129736:88-960(+)
MRTLALVLACWAYAGHPRRVQLMSEQRSGALRADGEDLLRLLLALKPATAFNPSSQLGNPKPAPLRTSRCSSLTMAPKLHGSQQSRSPLVNWYANEAGIELEMVAPRPSNHPFQQIPFLTDDGGVEIFESGAILLYLADAYGSAKTAQERAQYSKWVVWSNSELDGLCFGAVPGDHRVRGTSMDRPDLKSVKVLNDILSESDWLVDGEFSVADVAVGSYLNYVPIFFPDANLGATPAIAKYMQRCAERPGFAQAFGDGHAQLVKAKVAEWLSTPPAGGGGGLGGMLNKLR